MKNGRKMMMMMMMMMNAGVEEVRNPGMKVSFYATGGELGKQSRTPDSVKCPRCVQGDGTYLLFESY